MTYHGGICPVCDQTHTGDPYDSHDVRGLLCQRDGCGKTIDYPVTYQGLGCFCSHECSTLALLARDAHRKAG